MAILHLMVFGVWLLAGWAVAEAAAPTRSGQPYAEATLCASADVIFCEDFNYPANFSCGPIGNGHHHWINPGWALEVTDFVYGCEGRRIDAATGAAGYTYTTKPNGHMHSIDAGSCGDLTTAGCDHIWAANWDDGQGTAANGGSPGLLRNGATTYVNGTAKATDLYYRFQIYWTSNYAWPGDPKTDKYAFGTGGCVDNKILFIGPKEWLDVPTDASYDAGPLTGCGAWDEVNNARYADFLQFRVGTNSEGYKTFPLCTTCTISNQHNEYQYQCTANDASCWRNPDDTPIDVATQTRAFRFNTGQWYTLEFRYKLSTADTPNGIIEAWIDGVKIYSASDLRTCGSGNGGCDGHDLVWVGAYHNGLDDTAWTGRQIIDNLVISTAPIGMPAGDGTSSLTPPVGQATLSGSAPNRVVGTLLTPRGAARTLLLFVILAVVGLGLRYRRSRCS